MMKNDVQLCNIVYKYGNDVNLRKFERKQDHLRMKVAPDQTIILGLQIFLDHRFKILKSDSDRS